MCIILQVNNIRPKHLVLVRHGESEGDVRRSKMDQPTRNVLKKHPRDEEQTELGHRQSLITGRWISKHILQRNNIECFDWQMTSPLIRTIQSTESLSLNKPWIEEPKLLERDRGLIQGMTRAEHQAEYPNSFTEMKEHPYYWRPPNGESLLRVSMRIGELINSFMESDANSAIFMTHRDLIWSSYLPLMITSVENIESVNTEKIENSQITYCTNVNPHTRKIESTELLWIQTTTPWKSSDSELRKLHS